MLPPLKAQNKYMKQQENMSPTSYIPVVKLGFTEVYIFFLFLFQTIDCGYLLEPPRRGGSNVYPLFMF